jgi:hypothetical protein
VNGPASKFDGRYRNPVIGSKGCSWKKRPPGPRREDRLKVKAVVTNFEATIQKLKLYIQYLTKFTMTSIEAANLFTVEGMFFVTPVV